ncbi:hypothetical protein HQ393_13280 [Chitinibacter bivalviorum]|uniref:STAS/SEC14 domain-containing protein n=1 Tax=Chitinibacter bivalviorum TaxID=2739434 RepID=A0A7H9BLA8_9NEIS|nr:hypothetical protein [Chitinibacter bivalviorum]QLG89136.1 hypothetical protein HQ393_13280 [Chitinibacter bivalviorum]
MPNWVQHGEFQLRWQGDVLIVTYSGLWNEQAVIALRSAVMPAWLARGGEPWAMLTNAAHWEGGTPEVLEAWWGFFEECVSYGLLAVTDILPSHFHALVVKSLAERASQLVNYRRSNSMSDAARWLAEQGFPMVPPNDHR